MSRQVETIEEEIKKIKNHPEFRRLSYNRRGIKDDNRYKTYLDRLRVLEKRKEALSVKNDDPNRNSGGRLRRLVLKSVQKRLHEEGSEEAPQYEEELPQEPARLPRTNIKRARGTLRSRATPPKKEVVKPAPFPRHRLRPKPKANFVPLEDGELSGEDIPLELEE